MTIDILKETASTSADLLSRLREGVAVPEGAWIVADRQTAGRGRLGRTWSDGAGNFMGSTVVRPGAGDPPAETLALVAGLAVHTVCSAHAPDAPLQLKWPNDLLAGSAKLAGILLEREGNCVVVGIGVNLVSAPDLPERETTSLAALGKTPPRDSFARDLAETFAAELLRWRRAGLAALLRRWQVAAHPPGTPLVVAGAGEEPLHGSFDGLAADGGLQLRLADGTRRIIHSGEVDLATGSIQERPAHAAGDRCR